MASSTMCAQLIASSETAVARDIGVKKLGQLVMVELFTHCASILENPAGLGIVYSRIY